MIDLSLSEQAVTEAWDHYIAREAEANRLDVCSDNQREADARQELLANAWKAYETVLRNHEQQAATAAVFHATTGAVPNHRWPMVTAVMANPYERPNVAAARKRRQETLSIWTLSSLDHELAPWGEVLRWRPRPEALYAAAADDLVLQTLVREQVAHDTHIQWPQRFGPRGARRYTVGYVEETAPNDEEQRGTTSAQNHPASLNSVEEQTLERLEPEPVVSREEAMRRLLGEASIFDVLPSYSREELISRLLAGDSLRTVERHTGVSKSTLQRWMKETRMQMLEERIGRLEVEQDRIARQMERLSRESLDDATFLREIDAYLLGATEARGVALQTSSP